MNILLDTGDGNDDFRLNSRLITDDGIEKDETISIDASVVWLAKQQGYSKTQVDAAFEMNTDNFFKKLNIRSIGVYITYEYARIHDGALFRGSF